jgi:lysophospholipase L1-like esterase
MKILLFILPLLLQLAIAADPNYATQPVPRDEAWKKRHESFNEISKKGEAPLVFLGDSITQGWSGKGKATWEQFYTPRKAANFGIGGDRTEHVLWRLQNGNFNGLSPKLIVLMIGTNNTGHVGRPQKELNGTIYQCNAEQTAEGVKLILEALKKKCPSTQILLLGIFPRGEKPTDIMRQQNIATNALIAKYADGSGVHYLDLGTTFLKDDGTLTREIMPDLLHLSEKGYAMWAEAMEPTLKKLLGE